jgi:hypothetical protein
MSTRTPRDWRLIRKRFFVAFAGSLLFAILIFFSTGFFGEEQHGIVLISAAGILWCICAGVALRRIPFLDVVAIAAGLAWGFLFSLSAAISIRNGHVSINWPTMIPGLLLIPLAVAATVFPFWFISRRRRHENAA